MTKNKSERPKDHFKEYPLDLGMRSKSDGADNRRLALIQNMYYNPESESEGIESIPGYRRIYRSKETIHSLALLHRDGESSVLFHSGDRLYRLSPEDNTTEAVGMLTDGESRIFSLEGLCLVSSAEGLFSLSDEGLLLISDSEKHALPSSAVLMDRRLFLSKGGEIFFSDIIESERIEFPDGNRITVGEDILSLTVYGGRLWAFTRSRIICLDGRDGYPVYLSIEGVRPLGQAIPFGNEIIFLTPKGLYAIENPTSRSRVKITKRSEDIAPLLRADILSSACLTVWIGYVLISLGDKLLMARQDREGEYQWYVLSGVGAHPGDRPAFRYSDKAEEGYRVHKEAHTVAEGEVISLKKEDGVTLYFVEESGEKYAVYPTEQRIGGDISSPEITLSDGRLLCFSAGEEIFLFNNDLPRNSGNRDEYYSFDRHAPVYIIKTHFDRVGLPVGEKSSDGESLYLKIKASSSLPLSLTVNTDKCGAYRQRVTLSALPECECRTVSLAERAHGWIEKQVEIKVDEYASPFALCSMAYKYQVSKN